MTSFFAVYLFLSIAVIFLITGLIFKHSWLFWLSAIGWMATGFYCFTINDEDYVWIFGTFCFVVTLILAIVPTFIGKKPEPTPMEEDRYTYMANKIEKLRGTTERFKAKGKDVIL